MAAYQYEEPWCVYNAASGGCPLCATVSAIAANSVQTRVNMCTRVALCVYLCGFVCILVESIHTWPHDAHLDTDTVSTDTVTVSTDRLPACVSMVLTTHLEGLLHPWLYMLCGTCMESSSDAF